MISDLCDPNPCQNGGTCNLGNCQCAEGYTGAMCEIGNPKVVLLIFPQLTTSLFS